MRIKKIISQHRRDFQAIYECEHCGHTEESYGYDDEFYHREVIPNKVCGKCGKQIIIFHNLRNTLMVWMFSFELVK